MVIKDLILKTEKVNWQELKDLQPTDLKVPYHNSALKESLVKNNFAMAIAVWQDPKTQEIYICDGHTRRDTLVELKSDGFDIPEKLTCNFLDLPNRKEAVKKLLEVYNTKKNPIDEATMVDWIEEEEVEDVSVDWLDIQIQESGEVEELEAKEDDFEAPERNQIETDIVKGDIFEIKKNGEVLHRLGCGSSTDIDFVLGLKGDLDIDGVLTDPPYGVDITKTGKGNSINDGRYIEIAGDQDTEIAKEFYQTCVALNLKNIIIWGGNYFTDFLPSSRCWIIWDKEVPRGMSFARGEMAWTDFNKNMEIYKKKWTGNLLGNGGDVLDKEVLDKEVINKSSRAIRSHPTQKSIELHGNIINDFFKSSKVIFDGFGGSGTTLLACHQTNKTCLMVEFIPEYCQVILNRIQKLDPEVEIVKVN